MPTIKLSANYIESTDTPIASIFGARDSGHLQIVYDSGVSGSLLVEAEVQAPIILGGLGTFAGDWVFQPFGQQHGANTDYISNVDVVLDTDRYASVDLSFGTRTAEDVWELMRSLHNAFSNAGTGLDYDVQQNSNSYVNTMLWMAGVDLANVIGGATPSDVLRFPGAQQNVLLGSNQGTSETEPLDMNLTGNNSGTDKSDFIRLGIGNDIVEGGGGDDELDGGDQRDGGADIALFSGDGLDYDVRRNGDGTVTVTHARGSMTDGTDTLRNFEIARFGDDRELDLTVAELGGFTLLSTPTALVEASGTLLPSEWMRSGDLSYSLGLNEDGEVIRSDRFTSFLDGVYDWAAGQIDAQRGVIVTDGSAFENDELLRVAYTAAEMNGLEQSILFELSGAVVEFGPVVIDYLATGDDGVDDRGGVAFGDPHLLTFDNIAFDFQAAGEFFLTRSTTGSDYQVQARFVSISSAVSVANAMATTVDGIIVSVAVDRSSGIIEIDGAEFSIASGETVAVGTGSVSRSGRTVEIDHGNGDLTEVQVFSTSMTISPQPSRDRDGELEGLFGNGNGSPTDDFQLSDGTILTTPIPIETLYGDFAASWTIAEADSILPDAREEYDAPDRIVTIDSLPTALREAAEAMVDEAGITNPLIRDAAILDFALTGNVEFIEAAALIDSDFDPIVGTVTVDPVSSPVIVLTSDSTILNEEDGGTATLTVSRGDIEGDLTVNYAIAGTGTSPASADDFKDGIVSGSVVIADGAESATFVVESENDNIDEGPETFDVSIALEPDQASAFELLVSSVRLTIEDDDEEGTTINDVLGSADSDNLIGTDGADAIRSFAGSYDKMFGGDGADQFIFGSEANNGTRERDVILDYEVGIDEIVLTDGASIASIRQTSSQVVVFLDDDRDAIYVRGDGVTADNLTIVNDDVFAIV